MDIDFIFELIFGVICCLVYIYNSVKKSQRRQNAERGYSISQPRERRVAIFQQPAQQPAPHAQPARRAHAPHPGLFNEGERVTNSNPSPINAPHISSKEERRQRAMRNLGLKDKEDLKRAIILGQILQRPESA